MRNLKVGIWINENYDPLEGGGYGYYTTLLNAITEYSFKNADISLISNKKNLKSDSAYIINWKPKRWLSRLKTFTNYFIFIPFVNRLINWIGTFERNHNDKLKTEISDQVDIIYYLNPVCVYPDFPYICTLWDIGHKTSFAFPELTMNKSFEWRKSGYEFFPHKALMIFAESDTGKQDIVHYLNINEDRIKVVPIFPSVVISTKVSSIKPASADENLFFIFYNAQFWAHKNHYNLLIGFSEVLGKYPDLKLIFTGTDRGNKKYILQIIQDLKLTSSVLDLGFVTYEELKWLYLNSQGLVMPTFLGPTNMPLLEAAELGCPVACSNLPGHIEELGDYGYYFDAGNPHSIALQIDKMIIDKKSGINKKYVSNFNIENTLKAIDNALTEMKNIRFCWGANDEIY